MAPHGSTIAPVLTFGRENPPGSIIAYTMPTAPIGWLVCDGSAVNRVDYRALFDVIGTTFGEGDGEFTFNLPDYRGAFLRGTGTAPNEINSGPDINSAQADAIKEHNHDATVYDPGHNHTQNTINDDFNNTGTYEDFNTPSFAQHDGAETIAWPNINSRTTGITVTIQNTGINETRPYNYGVVWLIKY